MKAKFAVLFAVLFFLIAAGQTVFSQGFLVNESSSPMQLPRPSSMGGRRIVPLIPQPTPISVQSYTIKEISVDAKIKDQIAEVNVSQTFTNTGSAQMEVSFVFPIPYDGAIDQMVLLVDGKEYPAKLQDAKDARKTYEDIVRRNRDPALLEWIGTGMFKTSVFPVPAGASRTVTLRYSQLLRNESGVSDFLFPLSAAKYTANPVGKISISATIDSSDELKNIYSPTHEINVKRPSSKTATVSFERHNIVLASDFRLLFDMGDGEVNAKILSFRADDKEDGYFLMLASPKIIAESKKPLPKTVLLVLDKSGSMSGVKINQARDALKFVLNNLNENDTFNIITYNDRIELFRTENQMFNSETRKAATDFCDSIRAGGSTNIGDALSVSLKMLQDKKQPNYVLFLTDGQPTVGEQNEMKLAEIAKNANDVGARIFSFGVGFDLNSRLLDRISRDNRGQTEFVLPDENIEGRISQLYSRISSPMLSDVSFEIRPKESSSEYITNQVYPSGTFDLFAGQQLVIVERYSKPGDILINVKGNIGETPKEFVFDGNLTEKTADQTFGFIERLWAMRRIGEILDQIDLNEQNKELTDELVALSLKHGILTPYTSFLADENTVLTARNENANRATSNLGALRDTSGDSGVIQRGMKQTLQYSDSLAQESQERFSNVATPSPAPDPTYGSPSYRGGVGGMGGRNQAGSRIPGIIAGASTSPATPSTPAPIMKPVQQNVQTINNRAFFQKGNIWIDSTLTESQQEAKNVIVVKQFSDEYFKLIEEHGKEISQYLVFDEPVLLNFNGQAYKIEL